MTRVLWLLIACLVVFTSGCTQPTTDTPVLSDPCADQSFRDELLRNYEADMLQAQTDWGLPLQWTEWVTTPQHKEWYANPYIHARCRNSEAQPKVLVTYFGGRSKRELFFRGGWSQEKENHFRDLLERYMEEIFSGYNFYLSFNSPGSERISEEEASLVLVVGYTGPASFATEKYLYLIYPTIVGHEALHLCPQPYDQNGFCMGFGHHYCDSNIADHTSCAPPGEYEVRCIMHRNSLIPGPLEQTVAKLDLPLDTQTRESLESYIGQLGLEIRSMLPPEMAARGESELWEEYTPNELVQHEHHLAHKNSLQSSQYWHADEIK